MFNKIQDYERLTNSTEFALKTELIEQIGTGFIMLYYICRRNKARTYILGNKNRQMSNIER